MGKKIIKCLKQRETIKKIRLEMVFGGSAAVSSQFYIVAIMTHHTKENLGTLMKAVTPSNRQVLKSTAPTPLLKNTYN